MTTYQALIEQWDAGELWAARISPTLNGKHFVYSGFMSGEKEISREDAMNLMDHYGHPRNQLDHLQKGSRLVILNPAWMKKNQDAPNRKEFELMLKIADIAVNGKS